jgi:transposase
MGFRSHISKSTLADANENRDWRIYADYAQILIHIAKDLYKNDPFELDIAETVYALDSSTIDLCLNVFPWAKFRKTKSAIKMHTLFDVKMNIPDFIEITHGKFHDVNILDILIPQPGSFYIMDRAYNDFERLYQMHLLGAFFIIRAKSNMQYRRIYSHKIEKELGLKCDQTIRLTGLQTQKHYPDKLRCVRYFDSDIDKRFTFITNQFLVDAINIAQLYKCRWQIELFFKWIKQHLRIKTFYGTSENAVKTQIWIAVCVYVLISIVKKNLNLNISLYTFLDILSISPFEEVDILQLVTKNENIECKDHFCKQLFLFDF